MATCVKHAAHAMVEQRVRGSIVCTGSVAGSKGGSKRTDYAMSKHAVLGLVRSASLQLGVHGIRVNRVSPSAVPTSLTGSLVEEVKTIHEPLTSLKGVEPTVRQTADAVMFLVCDDSAFVTGQDLIVDGGLVKLPGQLKENNL